VLLFSRSLGLKKNVCSDTNIELDGAVNILRNGHLEL